MSDLSNALQGKLNSRKGHVKDPGERQLDLFSSLADRAVSEPKLVMSKPDAAPAAAHPEPALVLPPAGSSPDVAAEVRAVLSDSGSARPVGAQPREGDSRAPLRTGVYQRPRRSPPPPAPTPPPRAPASGPRRLPLAAIRAWFAGLELDRRLISLVVVVAFLVALVAYWTARPRRAAEGPAPSADAVEASAVSEAPPAAPASASAVLAPAGAPAAPAPPAATGDAAGWKIPGAETVLNGGVYLVRFNEPVFVSAANISLEGMPALKALAKQLVALKTGARVVVTGYTDNQPLTKPTAQFRSNADIAAVRAKVAVEHLAQYARANKALAFEAQTGDPAQAPYPNDTPQNRRLNRTVTVQVIPAP